MTTTHSAPKNSHWIQNTILGVATVVVLGAVGIGVNYVWQQHFAPTPASAADCELAQKLFDRAQNAPTDPAQAEAWETELRKLRYAELKDEGLSTQLAYYAHYQTVKSTGQGERPTTAQYDKMKREALGHCAKSGVKLTIPDITY